MFLKENLSCKQICLLLSPDMAKLSSRKIVHKANHKLRSPLGQKDIELTRPVVRGWAGEPFSSFPDFILVPSASSSDPFCRPIAPTPVPLPPVPDIDLMNFD